MSLHTRNERSSRYTPPAPLSSSEFKFDLVAPFLLVISQLLIWGILTTDQSQYVTVMAGAVVLGLTSSIKWPITISPAPRIPQWLVGILIAFGLVTFASGIKVVLVLTGAI